MSTSFNQDPPSPWTGANDGNGLGVFARRFSPAGKGLGKVFRVNSYTRNYQSHPAIAVASSGDFVIAWQSLGQDGSRFGIFAKKYVAPKRSRK